MLQDNVIQKEKLIRNLHYIWHRKTCGTCYTTRSSQSRSGGIAILLSTHTLRLLKETTPHPHHTKQHRYLSLRTTLQGRAIWLHNIYAPVEEHRRAEVFAGLLQPDLAAAHIIGGDINTFLNNCLHFTQNIQIQEDSKTELAAWCAEANAQDVWRWRHPITNYSTSRNGSGRIDHICISVHLLQDANAVHIAPRCEVYHHSVLVTIGTHAVAKNRGTLAETHFDSTYGTQTAIRYVFLFCVLTNPNTGKSIS